MHHFTGLKHKTQRREGVTTPKHTRYTKALDTVTFIAGIAGPFTVLPQLYGIFVEHNAAGVSLLSWSLIFIVTLPWVFYGIAHRDRSIITSFVLWEIMNVLVVIGVLLYQ